MRAKSLKTAVIAVLLVMAGAYLLWARHHDGSQKNKHSRAAVPVLSATVAQRSMPVHLHAVGTVTAAASVAVKSRIDGQIVDVGFHEGQEVKEGQLLFRIDPRALQAQLHQAEAQLAHDHALLSTTRADVSRYTDLLQKNLVSHQELEKAQASLAQLEAVIQGDKAQVENYRVQLSYTTIRSPIQGRAGAILLTRGNMVKANDTSPLVVINQLKPIDVSFAVAERELPAIRRAMAAGNVALQVIVADDNTHPVEGQLYFIDNAADPATATVKLKGRFANSDLALWPGQFVNVSLQLGSDVQALVVPAEAVQQSQKGSYVYAIKTDDSVEIKPVVVERVSDGLAVITRGLQVGERVVTDGQLRLKPGSKVSQRKSAAAGEGGAKAQ